MPRLAAILAPQLDTKVVFITNRILFFCCYCFVQQVSALSLATWNMQWLSSEGDSHGRQRNAADYEQLHVMQKKINADVYALQEVNDTAALGRVFSPAHFHFYLSDKARLLPRKGSQQYTAWAIKKGIKVIDRTDNMALSLPEMRYRTNLRFGNYIEISTANYPSLHLLSVHLKSGCFATYARKKARSQRACDLLEKQVTALADWINARTRAKQQFIILGDFNHYLAEKDDWFWSALTALVGEQTLVNLSAKTKAKCKVIKTNHYTNQRKPVTYYRLIDHLIASQSLFTHEPFPEAKQISFSASLNQGYYLTDHCPLVVRL